MNDTAGQIIDLAEEKVYDLDIRKKSLQGDHVRRASPPHGRSPEEGARPGAERGRQNRQNAPPDKQMEIDFDVKNTGQKKNINGFDTHEAIVTVTVREKGKTLEQGGGMVMTSDMWLAPTIKEMKEIRDFDVRYAQKLYGPVVAGASAEQMAAAVAMYPMMKQAIGKMSAEGGKIDGTPVMTTTTMDAVKSEEQMAADAKPADDQSTKPPSSVGGLLGGFAKKAAAKKMASGDDAGKARTTFMTSTTEVLKVVTQVGPDELAVPPGSRRRNRIVGFRVQGAGCWVRSWFGVLGSEFGVRSSEFGVRVRRAGAPA